MSVFDLRTGYFRIGFVCRNFPAENVSLIFALGYNIGNVSDGKALCFLTRRPTNFCHRLSLLVS